MNSKVENNISYKAAGDLLDMDINVIGNIIKRTGQEINELTSKKRLGKKRKKELDTLDTLIKVSSVLLVSKNS